MKVISYHCGIPSKNNSPEKPAILNNFIQGVNASGDTGINHHTMDVLDCDVAVLQGFVHEQSKNSPHLNLRRRVLNKQKNNNNRTLIVDSNLFLYLNKTNKPFHYLRYSFDGVFRDTGFYFDKDIDPNRWKKISSDLDIKIKPYRSEGNHILICLQRNGGWSMKGINVMDFCNDVIRKIRKQSDRPIVVRAHPGDAKAAHYLKLNIPRVSISTGKTIQEDLKNAWATVVYNSSPGVASLIEGIPVFQMDPNPNYSMFSEVANTSLKRLEDPKLYDRQEWLERISMCHWKFSETASGEAWSYMKNYV